MIEIPDDLQRSKNDAEGLFGRIRYIDVSRDLIRTAELGALSDFSPVATQLQELQSIMLQLGDGGFESLPAAFAAESGELARDYLELKDRIGKFDGLRSGEPEKEREALMDVVRGSFARISLEALPLLALRRSLMSIDLLKASTGDNPIIAELVRLRDEIVALRDEAKAASEAAQAAAGLTGVSSYAAIFRLSARRHLTAARYWLATAGIVASSVIVWVGIKFWPLRVDAKLPTPELVSVLFGKTVVLSITGVALGVCVKSFSAHRHNAVVDQHREQALQTFEAFVEAAAEGPTRDAILLETTRSIFAPASTGFLRVDNAEIGQGSYMAEIVKAVTGK
jgi:hypothetical protein